MKHQDVSINHPAQKPTTSERGQNPSAQADTAAPGAGTTAGQTGQQARPAQSAQGSQQQGGKPAPTPNEIMNEQVSPRDEQGDRPQSDKPHVGG